MFHVDIFANLATFLDGLPAIKQKNYQLWLRFQQRKLRYSGPICFTCYVVMIKFYLLSVLETRYKPLVSPPFESFTASAFAVCPKTNGGYRVILDLSRPVGESIK